jgi:hypothetical protein
MKYQTIIGIDPGKSGAISILVLNSNYVSVFDVPLKNDIKKKNKLVYDKEAMAAIMRPYAGQNTLVCIESVHSMPGEGSSSSFSFGRGLGLWEGIVAGLECDCEMVTPQTWKKHWPDELIVKPLPKPEILILTTKELKKLGKAKQVEFDETKKEYSRKKAKQKEAAKDAARLLASKIYPLLADKFKLKKHDGRAESLLIAERKRLEIENAKR